MDLQVLHKAEDLLERAGRAGVTVELLDNGKLRMRRLGDGPRAAAAAEALRKHREDVAAVLAIPRPTVEQELERDERGWIILGQAIGACVVCDEPCRSWDDEDHPRHLNCELQRAAA